MPKAVHENIDTIARARDERHQAAGGHQRALEAASRRIGRPATVYGLLASVAVWILYNIFARRLGCKEIDPPPFFWMQGTIGLLDTLLAATVLTAQSRQNRDAEQRGHLELQVALLTEQKTTKIIALLEELRRDLPSVRNRRDSEAEALQEAVDPKAVLSVLEHAAVALDHK